MRESFTDLDLGMHRRKVLKLLGLIPAGAGLTAGGASALNGTATTEVETVLQIDSIATPTAPDATIVQPDELRFRVVTALRQGDTLPIEVTIINEAGGPATVQADLQTPDKIVPDLSVNDSSFTKTNVATLRIQLQATNAISPGFYTTDIKLSPVSIESESGPVEAKADVHFLLDNSASARNDLETIKNGIDGFFNSVEQATDEKRTNLAASVSAFGGKKSETSNHEPETRIVEQLTTVSADVEDAARQVQKDDESGLNEDGYTALENALNGEAGIRSGASQIPILFADELGPNIVSEKGEILNLQDRVKREATGFIGIGDTGFRPPTTPDIELDEFTKNVTNDINGIFIESSNLTTEKLAGEIAETVRVAAVANAKGTLVDEGTFVFKI